MKRLFVIGDSISLDYGPHLQAALPSDFAYARKGGEEEAYLDLDVPRGANGGDSAMVLAYLQGLAGTFRTDILLLNCGLHDIKRDPETDALQVSPAAYCANLEAIVGLAGRIAARTAWVRTTPVDDDLHARRKCGFHRRQSDVLAYNRLADEVMRGHGIPVFTLDGFTLGLRDAAVLYRDGVHFQKAVQAAQGRYLAACLVREFSADTLGLGRKH